MPDRKMLGFQVVEPFATYTAAFDHVGTLGTYVDLAFRRQGIARRLFEVTLAAACDQGYEKIFTFVRADNPAALAAYQAQGFGIVGTARKHAHRRPLHRRDPDRESAGGRFPAMTWTKVFGVVTIGALSGMVMGGGFGFAAGRLLPISSAPHPLDRERATGNRNRPRRRGGCAPRRRAGGICPHGPGALPRPRGLLAFVSRT